MGGEVISGGRIKIFLAPETDTLVRDFKHFSRRGIRKYGDTHGRMGGGEAAGCCICCTEIRG